MKRIISIICITTLLFTGCASNKKSDSKTDTKYSSQNTEAKQPESKETEKNAAVSGLPQFTVPEEGEEIAVMTTNMGTIKIKFFPQYAPKAVENFITHSKDGYYNGLIFHRIINDFMIQGGDPKGTGTGGESIWKKPFEDEFNPMLHNFRGALSMANAGANTNGSQFFIVQAKKVAEELIPQMKEAGAQYFPEDSIKKYEEVGGTPHLDFRHTVFGQVFEGMDIVDKIAAVKTDKNDKPVKDVKIEKIEIIKYKK